MLHNFTRITGFTGIPYRMTDEMRNEKQKEFFTQQFTSGVSYDG